MRSYCISTVVTIQKPIRLLLCWFPFAARRISKIFFNLSEEVFKKKLLQLSVELDIHSSLHSLERSQNCCSTRSILEIFYNVAKEVFNEVSFSELHIKAQTRSKLHSSLTSNPAGSKLHSSLTSNPAEVSYT